MNTSLIITLYCLLPAKCVKMPARHLSPQSPRCQKYDIDIDYIFNLTVKKTLRSPITSQHQMPRSFSRQVKFNLFPRTLKPAGKEFSRCFFLSFFRERSNSARVFIAPPNGSCLSMIYLCNGSVEGHYGFTSLPVGKRDLILWFVCSFFIVWFPCQLEKFTVNKENRTVNHRAHLRNELAGWASC